MTKVNAAPHLLQHSLKAQKLSEKKVHWCQKKNEKKKEKGAGKQWIRFLGESLFTFSLLCTS